MHGVFVCYRRSDSAGHAGRIHDRLVAYYGDGRVFRDIEDIAAGDDFVQTIRDTLSRQDVLLVVIGPSWLHVEDESGRRRLDNPRDVVRLEIAEALQRNHTRVIPVLVNGAVMPRADELPAPLAPLATRNAIEILDTRFADDVTRLIQTIGGQPAGRVRKLAIGGGLSVLGAVAATIIVASVVTGSAAVAADVAVYRGGGTIEGSDRDALVTATIADTSAPISTDPVASSERQLYTVSYHHQRNGRNHTTIDAALPYRDMLRSGGTVMGGAGKIFWEWPRLSVQIVNNSERTLYVSGVEIDVRESVVDTEPLILVKERLDRRNYFEVLNYGWGIASNPTLEVDILAGNRCDDDTWEDTERKWLNIADAKPFRPAYEGVEGPVTALGAGVHTPLDVSALVTPTIVRQGPIACLVGVLRYETENQDQRTVRFKTRILVSGTGPLAAVSPSNEYFIYLEAGKSGYVKTLSVDHQVSPGSVEHFLLRVGTNKSASFDLGIHIQTVDNDPILADNVELTILTPTYDPDLLRDPEKRR